MSQLVSDHQLGRSVGRSVVDSAWRW